MQSEENKAEKLPAVKEKVDLTSGIVPKDFNELNRFAALVNRAGLSPKSFDTPEKVAIGILTNMELGRPIITGLQDLAIINGRCGIYGDASLAMVTASGLMDAGYPIEEESGTPLQDDWTFTFKVKRKRGPERVGTWTWAEAKRAGFDNPMQRDGKPDRFSPWRRFTRRMMQWKARNYVLRDTFGDILKGMKTVEDLHDMDGVVELQEIKSGEFEKPESLMNVLENGHKTLKEKLKTESVPDIQFNDEIPKLPAESQEHEIDIEKGVETADEIKKEAEFKVAPASFATVRTTRKVDGEESDDSVENIKNWKWKKKPGFIDYVATQKDEIKVANGHVKKAMRDKWVKQCKLDPETWDETFGIEKPENESGTIPENATKPPESENIETSEDEGTTTIPQSENGQSGSTVEVSVTDSAEWDALIKLQQQYPEIYREKIGQGVFKTIEDILEAISIIEDAAAPIFFLLSGSTVEVSVTDSAEWDALIKLQQQYPEIYREKIGQRVFKTIEDILEAISIIEDAAASLEFDMGGKLQ